jgi:hypothetical protein
LIRPGGSLRNASSITAAVFSGAEALARARASAAALAIVRYQRANAGAVPATLGDLVPQYLAVAPIDPYTGLELRYIQEGSRFKVYAAGIDRQDDGGVWDRRSDVQIARRGLPKDVGIAVGAWPTAGVR